VPERAERVTAAVERRAEAHVRRLQALVQIARDGEDATQAWVASALREAGCAVESFRYAPRALSAPHQFASDAGGPAERTCVVGRLGPAAPPAARLLLFAHPDVEPVAGVERWRHAPFAGTTEDGRLYGWGVADDLTGVATMLGAVTAIRDAGLAPRRPLLAASTPSKRSGLGIVALLDRGHRAEGAVYLHPAESGHGLAEIKAVTCGLLRFRLSVPGRPADTREPEQTPFHHQAVNPIEKACDLVGALRALSERRAGRVRHAALEAAIGRATNLQLAYIHAGDPDLLGRVSETCVLAGTVTFPPDERLEDVQKEIDEAVAGAATLEWLAGVRGAAVAPGDPLHRALGGAIRAVTGREPAVNALHASSDIGHPILHAGIPTLGFGPRAGDLVQAGGHDEWVDVADYIRAITITARLVAEWCDADGERA
jgi:acetylornithine deacetylase